jgi:3-oxoacyl-[acyl-carrier protein] reductase
MEEGGIYINLQGKVAVITGAGQGIGKATAYAFAQAGATLAAADINEDRAREVAQEAGSRFGVSSYAIKTDVVEKTSVQAMMTAVTERFGTIDILVNNAGICQSAVDFEDLSDEDWDKLLAVNLKGTINCIRAVIPIFKRKKYGKIINMSSLAGEVGGIATAVSYATSKAAILGLTKTLAKNLGAYNINVNAVAPGFIRTAMTADLDHKVEMIPLLRLGQPEEVADVVLFLASERSRYITGATIDVNGGIGMR